MFLRKLPVSLIVAGTVAFSASAWSANHSAPAAKAPAAAGHSAHHAAGQTPYDKNVQAAMDKMHKDMQAAPMNGNPDHDFITMMIPHHQGAIDMAKELRKVTKDPMLTKMADDVVTAQQREIGEMLQWLRDKGYKQDAATMQKMIGMK